MSDCEVLKNLRVNLYIKVLFHFAHMSEGIRGISRTLRKTCHPYQSAEMSHMQFPRKWKMEVDSLGLKPGATSYSAWGLETHLRFQLEKMCLAPEFSSFSWRVRSYVNTLTAMPPQWPWPTVVIFVLYYLLTLIMNKIIHLVFNTLHKLTSR